MNLLMLIISSKIIVYVLIFIGIVLYIRIRFFKIKIYFLKRDYFKGHKKLIDINGIIHFHTIYSDGSGKIENLIKIAKRQKADFLVSSDHNTLKPKYDGLEGYYGKLLYFAGEEINTEFGHFLAVGIKDEIKRGSYKDVLSNIKKQNGVGIICHPHNWWTPWKNFTVKAYDGIEIINLDSQWRGINPLYLLLVLLTYKINSFYSMHFFAHKPKKTIKFWDSVQKHNSLITGIASIDAHSNVKLTEKTRLKFPKYEELFSIARTHVLLHKKLSDSLEEDKSNIVKAIKNGSCYFSFDMFGEPEGYYFEAEYDGKFYSSGDILRINIKNGINKYFKTDNARSNTSNTSNGSNANNASNKINNQINFNSKTIILHSGININPKKTAYETVLLRNGKKIHSVKNASLVYKVPTEQLDRGASFYRNEINIYSCYKKITYLYSNNIEIYIE